MNLSYISLFSIIGLILMPFLKAENRLKCVIFFSFVGSYAIAVGSVKILPGPIFALTTLIFSSIGLYQKKLHNTSPKTKSFAILTCFALYSLLVTFFAPVLFSNIVVMPPSEQIIKGLGARLSFTMSSLAQIVYLCLNYFLFIIITYRVKSGSEQLAKKLFDFTIACARIFCLIVLAETLLSFVGLRIPIFNYLLGDSFFESKPIIEMSSFMDIPFNRASAVFGEASYFSVLLAGSLGASILKLRTKDSVLELVDVILLIITSLLTFSTTAILSSTLICFISLLVPVHYGNYNAKISGSAALRYLSILNSNSIRILIVIAVPCLAALLFFFVSNTPFGDIVFGKLSNVDGYEVGNVSSGSERLYWDAVAFRAFYESLFLGVGLGATRASSFVLNTLASSGFIGLLFLLVIIVFLSKKAFSSNTVSDVFLAQQISVFLIGCFIALAISVPDAFSFFYVWILLSCLCGMTCMDA